MSRAHHLSVVTGGGQTLEDVPRWRALWLGSVRSSRLSLCIRSTETVGFDTASSIALLAISAISQRGSDGEEVSHGRVVILSVRN